MMNKALLLATIFATACVATTDDSTGMPQDEQARPGAPTAAAPVPPQPGTTVITSLNKTETVCDMLPEDGPCSLACDPQALVDQYVLAGTCATFTCHLSDGQPFLAGGCHW